MQSNVNKPTPQGGSDTGAEIRASRLFLPTDLDSIKGWLNQYVGTGNYNFCTPNSSMIWSVDYLDTQNTPDFPIQYYVKNDGTIDRFTGLVLAGSRVKRGTVSQHAAHTDTPSGSGGSGSSST